MSGVKPKRDLCTVSHKAGEGACYPALPFLVRGTLRGGKFLLGTEQCRRAGWDVAYKLNSSSFSSCAITLRFLLLLLFHSVANTSQVDVDTVQLSTFVGGQGSWVLISPFVWGVKILACVFLCEYT